MKNKILVSALAIALVQSPIALATNWFELQNSEPSGAPAYRFWGFIQPQYVTNLGGEVNGIAAPAGLAAYNGKTPQFNKVGPDLNSRDQLQIFRARPGLRGVMPGTDEKINYFLLAELGNNGLTRERSPILSDASVSFNYIPGARIRAGLGRLPIGEEAMLGEPAMDYINFTGVTDGLLNERFVNPYVNTARTHAPVLGVQLRQSQVVGAAGAFRDVGIEAYDWFTHEQWEYAYGLMVSQGNGVSFDSAANSGNHDVTGRLQASYIFGGKGPRREDITVFAWRQSGDRAYAGSNYSRVREGVGAKYVQGSLRVSGEYIRGKGMIYVGKNPPFSDIGAPAFEPVDQMAVESSNESSGYYLDMGWKLAPKWEADVRYDLFDKMSNSAFDERIAKTWTIGGQYFYSPALRLVVNYEFRTLTTPDVTTPGASGTALAQQTQLADARIVADSMGSRLSAQLTYQF
jgi:hypothetical protein